MTILVQDRLTTTDAATAKYWCREMAFEVADQAVQMHGGYATCSSIRSPALLPTFEATASKGAPMKS